MTNLRARIWAGASALALTGMIAACDGLRQTEPAAPVDGPSFAAVANEQIDFPTLVIPDNPCTEELFDAVTLEGGKLHILITDEIDPLDPTVVARLHINSSGVKGTGADGSRYNVKISDNTRLVADADPTNNIRFQAKDDTTIWVLNQDPEGGDLKVRARAFVTDNNLVQFVFLDAECGQFDEEADL
jgi:hypothetical protein